MENPTAPAWFVLRTGTMQMKVAQALRAKGFEVFVPMQERRRQWSDRVKAYLAPIFTSFVFCRYEPKDRIAVLSTPGVSRERDRGGMPLAIPDADIEHLRRIAELSYPAEECDPLPIEGQEVQIKGRPDIRGFLIDGGTVCRVLIRFESIGRAVVLQIPLDALEIPGAED